MVNEHHILHFLENALQSQEFKLFPLAGDASSRRYTRIVKEQSSYVLMQWEPFDPSNYPFLSVLHHFAQHQVKVPQVIAMDSQQGLILLEDLGDLTLERKFWESQNQSECLDFYKSSIDELIKIHHHASSQKTDCTAFKLQFDTEKLLWEMNYGLDHLILGVMNYKMSESRILEVKKVFTSLCERLHAEPKRIAHRDYHSRNLMIKLGEVRVIDFQDARLGTVQYDLVSLLRDSYTDLNEESSQVLIDDYLLKSKRFLPVDFSKEKFMLIYELQSVQRCFKACGSFASFYHQRQDRRYLKYLAPTLKRVMKACTYFPEYKILPQLLLESGCMEKSFEQI